MALDQLPPPQQGSRIIIEKPEPQTATQAIQQKIDHSIWYGLGSVLLLIVAIMAAVILVKNSKK